VSAAINVSLLLSFVSAAAVMMVIPGPSASFIVGRALAMGRPAALAAAAGNTLGATIQGALAVCGLGAVMSQSPVAFTIIKFAGAAYLLKMGFDMLRDRQMAAAVDAGEVADGCRRAARQGFVVGVTNPNDMLFFAAFLPQFVDPARGHVSLQLVVLLATFSVVSLLGDTSWGLAGGTIRAWTARGPRRGEWFMALSGVCVIAFAALLTV
jgi:threonine/homoserine/homoserine lactone efflux protein